MPRNKERLRREALDSTRFRGHNMRVFHWDRTLDRWRGFSTCRECGMYVQVLTHPMPNDIDIGGEAVATNCPYK